MTLLKTIGGRSTKCVERVSELSLSPNESSELSLWTVAGGKLTWAERLPCVDLMLTVCSLAGRQNDRVTLPNSHYVEPELISVLQNLLVISSPLNSMYRLTRVRLWYAANSAHHSGIFGVLNVLCGNSVKTAILPAQPAARSSPRDAPHVRSLSESSET